MSSSLWSSLLAFAAVIALIPIALALLKRTPLGAAAAAGPMRVVATLPLAPNQRLLTVEVGSGVERKWLVLGVTAQSIATLHTMAPLADAVAVPNAAPNPPFAALLDRLRSRRGDGDAS
jgi:flagellar protein FliO/FliZ